MVGVLGVGRLLGHAIQGSGFPPAALFASGEQGAWYDPSDFSTMYQDSAGTTPVTAVDQPVGRILDKSGRGNHASQATESSRPLLKQDDNGKYYLLFDGTDDSLATSSIDFSVTDKVSVFAGVRKLAAGVGMIAETSNAFDTSSGVFSFAADAQSADYASTVRGSVSSSTNGRVATTYTAPITNLVTVAYDMAQTVANDKNKIRVNAATPTLTNAGANGGTGAFGNFPLYIGRRGGTTLPFNGRLYSLIVRGALSTNAQIVSTESWVNSKTGAY